MPQTDPKSPVSDSLLKKLIFYSLGGVITCLLCLVPMGIMGDMISDYVHNSPHVSLFEFVQIYSPARAGFWSHIHACRRHKFALIFPGAPILGITLGSAIGVFARRRRTPGHLLRVSLCVGFLFSCIPSVLFLVLCLLQEPQEPKQLLVNAPVLFICGAILGGSTTCFARLAESVVDKISRGKITAEDRADCQSISESSQSK